jgi:exodeoxyribonuclease V beta subunit
MKIHSPSPFEGEGGVGVGPDALPGGRMSGIFLHAVLEEIALSTVREHRVFDEWRERSDVLALFQRQMSLHDVQPVHLLEAQRLVFGALTLPLNLGDIRIPSLTAIDRERREVEFLCPVKGATGDPPVLLKGFIDMIFEYQGRFYVLDWKSDVLPDHGAEALARHVAEHYALQAHVYGMAVRRESPAFGGVVFLFLRGPNAHFVPPEREEWNGTGLLLQGGWSR